MTTEVRKVPKKRKFDLSELEESDSIACVPVSVVQSAVSAPPQLAAVDYSCTVRPIIDTAPSVARKQPSIDLSEWCDHRVLAKQGDYYYPGVIRQAIGTNVSILYNCCFTSTILNPILILMI